MPGMRKVEAGGILAIGLLIVPGCAARFDDSLHRPGPMESAAADRTSAVLPSSSARLQQSVMDFSDRYISALWPALDAYIAGEPDAAKQVKARRLKVALASAAMTIAASKDPRANLLDMAVFISAGRWAVDRHWIPGVFGEKAAGLRDVYARMDGEIGEEIDGVLSPAQRGDLRGLVAAWKDANPDPGEVMDLRLRNLEGVVLEKFAESPSAKGLLASVRRLLGNVDQSLLYGERMMFYLERTPLIISAQADLTVERVAERFPIATLNPDFNRWADFAKTLPGRINDAFASPEGTLRDAMPGLRDSLGSAERIAASVQATIAATDSLAEKIERLPFAKEDYTAALDGTTRSLTQLNGIVLGLNRLLDENAAEGGPDRLRLLARTLDERVDRATDAVFRRVVDLLGIFFGGLVLVLVVARLLFRRPRAVAVADAPKKPVP